MTTIRTACLTVSGMAEVIRQAKAIAGREWDSYDEEFVALEERATELAGYGLLDKQMVDCEIGKLHTLSGRPEFIRLDGNMFILSEHDDGDDSPD